MTCPSCAAPVVAGARFCASCGHPLADQVEERRVVTVVFADLVGFTALSESLDPERVKHLIDGCVRRLSDDVAAFGGRVDKVIGDAVVALFGAPVAHGDDAERAVRAALRMQQSVADYADEVEVDLRLRIGVNTGEVVVGRVGGDSDYTAMGDVVNTANRLQGLAEPGAVLVGPATHEATGDAIEYESLGHLRVRGREGAVAVWRALRPVGVPGRRPGGSGGRLVGRDDEFRLLTAAIDHTARHARAQLVLILGDAGAGKARLAAETARYAAETHGAAVLAGRCVPYGEADVWFAVADALRAAFEISSDTPATEATDRVLHAIATDLGVEPDDIGVRRVTVGLLHLLGYDTPLRSIDPERATAEILRAVRTVMTARADRGPVVLLLGDLHWADDALLDLVSGLLSHLSRHPFVVLATARHALLEHWAPRAGRVNGLSLSVEPLDDTASAALLTDLLGPLARPSLVAHLTERAGGNPLFLEELAAAVRRGDTADLAGLPGNLRALVSARLDNLAPEERRVLEDAAVLGRRGPITGLAAMGRQIRQADDVPETLRSLAEQDLLDVSASTWEFRSNLVREVAYDRLPKGERARRHAGVAAFLAEIDSDAPRASAVIAHHYRRAAELVADLGTVVGVAPDIADRAVEWTLAAARQAESSESMEVAARQYSEAMALLPAHDPRHASISLDRARALVLSHQVPAAAAELEALARRALSPTEQGTAMLLEADVAQRQGDYIRSDRCAMAAHGLFAAQGDGRGVGAALRLQGMNRLLQGDTERAEDLLVAAGDASAAAGDRVSEAWARQNLAWISFARGDAAQAEDRIDKAVALFTELGDATGVAWSRGLLGFVRVGEGRFAEARSLAVEASADARSRGDRWGQAMMLVLEGMVELWTGRPDRAVPVAESALAMFEELGEVLGELQARALLGRSLVRIGRVDEGRQVFDAPSPVPVDGVGIARLVPSAAALAALDVGAPDVAEPYLGVIGSGEFADLSADIERAVVVALAWLQRSRPDRALATLDEASPAAGGGPFFDAVRALALFGAGRHTEAADLARRVPDQPAATPADEVLALGVWRAACGPQGGSPDQVAAVDARTDELVRLAESDRVVAMIAAVARAAADAGDGSARAAAVAATRAAGAGAGWWRAFGLPPA